MKNEHTDEHCIKCEELPTCILMSLVPLMVEEELEMDGNAALDALGPITRNIVDRELAIRDEVEELYHILDRVCNILNISPDEDVIDGAERVAAQQTGATTEQLYEVEKAMCEIRAMLNLKPGENVLEAITLLKGDLYAANGLLANVTDRLGVPNEAGIDIEEYAATIAEKAARYDDLA